MLSSLWDGEKMVFLEEKEGYFLAKEVSSFKKIFIYLAAPGLSCGVFFSFFLVAAFEIFS